MTHAVRHLNQLFTPQHYTLRLDLTKRTSRTVSGTATITGILHKSDAAIILHSKDLDISKAAINGMVATTSQGSDDELSIMATTTLKAGEHTLTLTFTGTITDAMHGLYPCYFDSEGVSKELLMTQLEPHYAREVFPCIDEPAAKAVFDLTLLTEPDATVLSNTPVAEQHHTDKVLTTHFEPTPKMSSYLLAFVTGPLAYKETVNAHGVAIRAYTTPDKVEQASFALDFAAKVLDFYDDYFATPYPLPKCDIVAVPDFAAAAMENWGLITYREQVMLVDPANTAAGTKELIATVIAHELAHQWFGNLVTMQWWDDLWLNESFANWMEYHAVDHFHPEWQPWLKFASHSQQQAFARDGLAGVQAVRQPVHHPEELNSLFDPAIVYAKGSCLIRMLQQYVGESVFRDGLRLYMKRHRYANTTVNDLWAALTEVSDKDIATFMNPWLTQPGHPVVTVGVTGMTAVLHQRRFYSNPKQAVKHDPSKWDIPLLSKQLATTHLAEPTASLTTTTDALMLNDGYTGFYHTQYDSKQLARFAESIEDDALSTINRLGLLADTMALAKAGLISTAELMQLITAYRHEQDYSVWQPLAGAMNSLIMLVNNDATLKPHLQRYIYTLAREEYQRLGWAVKPGESYFDTLLRPTILSLMAYSEVTEVITQALTFFDAAQRPEDLLADIRPIVYAVAVRERGRPAVEQLLAWYKATTSAEERINIAMGATATKDPLLAEEITRHFTTKLIKLQDLFYWFIYLMRNPHGTDAAWQWMTTHWEWIGKQFKGDHDYADFPKYAASAFSTYEQLGRYRQFFEPKLDEGDIALPIRQGIEDIEVRAAWRERDIESIAQRLTNQH